MFGGCSRRLPGLRKQSTEQRIVNEDPVSFENLEMFRKGLRSLIAKGEADHNIKSAIIKTVVHKIEIYPDGFEIHFHVGESHYQASGNYPGASFFVSALPKKTKPSVGLPTESPFFIPINQTSQFLMVHGSRRLTNGGGAGNRTPVRK